MTMMKMMTIKRIGHALSNPTTTAKALRGLAAGDKSIVYREVEVPIPATATLNPATDEPVPPPTLHFFTGPWLAGKDGKDGVDGAQESTGPVVFYAHGGGYKDALMPAGQPRVAQKIASASGARAVVFIAYTRLPEAQYPGQLIQGVEAVRFLIEEENIKPEHLILAGDSAGGHLMASVLAHIAQPSPYTSTLAPALKGGRIGAAILVSPWFTWTHLDGIVNSPCDMLDRTYLTNLVSVLAPVPEDIWCEIVDAPGAAEVWTRAFGKGETGIIGKLLVTIGDSELCFRDARIFASDYAGCTPVVLGDGGLKSELKTIKESHRALAIGQNESHVQPMLDMAVGYQDGATIRAIQAFASSLRR